MSIVRISGGLGNQLFEVVFALVLAEQTNEESILDLIEFRFRNKSSSRPFELNDFLDFKMINNASIFTSHLPTRFSRAFELNNTRELNGSTLGNLPIIREVPAQNDVYDPELSRIAGHYYVGYFISHKYWNREPNYYFNLIYENLKRECHVNSLVNQSVIGMHIRRGDYIDNSKARNLHGYCKDDFYLNAVEKLIQNNEGIERVRISTDSLERIEHVIAGIQQLGLRVEILCTNEPIQDMVTLAECEYFIGSNSTFSWWAANLIPKKMAIFPKDWFVKYKDSFSLDEYFPEPVYSIENALTSEPYIV